MAERLVVGIAEVDRTQLALVGGKGANLGELARMPGIEVPAGFCVTTHAFHRMVAAASIDDELDRLALLEVDDHEGIREASTAVRAAIEGADVPGEVVHAIRSELGHLGPDGAFAVRSSATAEDLPTASFAGQQDSYLNVVGVTSVLSHVGRCWASLFTERAVAYRLRQNIEHRQVAMAVVVQRMVPAHAAGIVFTADPLTSNRRVVSIEATFGLGEALVSGRASADIYKVRDGRIVEKAVAAKELATRSVASGGTREEALDESQRHAPVLSDDLVLELAAVSRRIESHFGTPQDIEWCLTDDRFQVVQSRPITTLFPVPARDDPDNHVYVSVGHQQMMTDPMKPLGLSVWRLTSIASMHVAGGRLFVDVTDRLAVPASRDALLAVFGRGDPLIRDAMQTVVDRPGFLPVAPADAPAARPPGGPPATIETDPAIVTGLIARAQESIAVLKRDIGAKSGVALLEFIRADVPELRRMLFDAESQQPIMAGMQATWWLNDNLQEWLGEKNAADVLTRSALHNITSQMGLDLLDVADVIRPYPEVVAFLAHADDRFLDSDDLAQIEGGPAAGQAIREYLEKYGMRCVGEIDITRPRWAERPTALVPLILGHIKHFGPGEARRQFERGEREAAEKEVEVLARLRAQPDGEEKAADTKRMIDRVRTFIGYREYPKYGMICRYFLYKQALLAEADRLVQAGVLRRREDIFFLGFDELHEAVRAQHVDEDLIRRRRDEFASYRALTPPRVLTSEGEAVAGSYRRDGLPAGALVGLGVSAGTVEGRARVVTDMEDAGVEEGDILVTAHTDPSWSPLFVAVNGLVTEVGGLMTHGAVIAREYGLPAVVGVEHATRLIADGQRIRLHGTDGYIELLDD